MVVAKVNGEPIYLCELREELGTALSPETRKKTLHLLLDQLIEERLLLQKARASGLSLPETNLDLMMEEFSHQSGKPVETLAEEEGLTLEEWRVELRKVWLIGKVSEVICAIPEVKEGDARNYYFRHEGEFHIPEQVVARQIVVATRGEAEQLEERLKGGGDFAALAREYSIGPEAERGGELEPLYKGEEPPGFQILFSLHAGEISPVVKTPYGFHIFQVISKKGGMRMSLKEALPLIKRRLRREKRELCLKRWIEQARRGAKIEVYEAKLSLLEETDE